MFYRLINHENLGFGWSVRILGFTALATLLIPVFLMQQRVKPPRPRSLVDWTAFKDVPFMTFVFGCLIGFIGLYVGFFYISFYGQHRGYTSDSLSFYLVPILNSGSVFGRVLPNILSDKIGPLNVIAPGECEAPAQRMILGSELKMLTSSRIYHCGYRLVLSARSSQCRRNGRGSAALWILQRHLRRSSTRRDRRTHQGQEQSGHENWNGIRNDRVWSPRRRARRWRYPGHGCSQTALDRHVDICWCHHTLRRHGLCRFESDGGRYETPSKGLTSTEKGQQYASQEARVLIQLHVRFCNCKRSSILLTYLWHEPAMENRRRRHRHRF